MINRIPGQSSVLLLLKAGNDPSRTGSKQKSSAPGDPLLAALEKADPEKARALRKQLDESKSILERIKSAKVDVNEQRKAAAQEKIQRIKEELKALRMLASVNPEAAARRAAQLSRQLSAAVKEYASASGGAGAVGIGAGVSAELAGGANSMNPAGISGAATGTGGAAAPDAAAGTAVPAVPETTNTAASDPSGATAALQGQEEAPGTTPFAATDTLAEIAEDNDGDSASTIRAAIQEQAAGMDQSFGESRAHQEFVREVREIKNALKAIIELAKRKLEEKNDSSVDRDINDAERALTEVESSLAQISSTGLAGMTGTVNIFA
ncbi:MAG TPA: hypothetical protein DC046_07060 [Rhodospirillaceae bacterium]|nr:hypothetical protein [Rhodospirillaceae bacterium]